MFTGLAVFHFNPKAQLGNETYELQPLGTEGQGLNGTSLYNRIVISLPVGGGIKISTGSIGIGIEIGARRAYTDYLDDISTTYPDMPKLLAARGPVAVLLSDRSLTGRDTSSVISIYSHKQRGDSQDPDWYLFGGLTLTMRLESVLKDVCKPFKKRRY